MDYLSSGEVNGSHKNRLAVMLSKFSNKYCSN